MTTIMTRRALLAWGHTPPPELALVIIDGTLRHGANHRRVVTWSDILTQRRAHQRRILEEKRRGRELRAFRLRVAFYDQDVFGGWQALLETYQGDRQSVWVDKGHYALRQRLVTLYPLVLPFGDPWKPQWPAWDRWKVAFAQQYARRQQAHKPVGVTYVWWDGRDDLRHITACPCR